MTPSTAFSNPSATSECGHPCTPCVLQTRLESFYCHSKVQQAAPLTCQGVYNSQLTERVNSSTACTCLISVSYSSLVYKESTVKIKTSTQHCAEQPLTWWASYTVWTQEQRHSPTMVGKTIQDFKQPKTYKIFISTVFHLIFSDCK